MTEEEILNCYIQLEQESLSILKEETIKNIAIHLGFYLGTDYLLKDFNSLHLFAGAFIVSHFLKNILDDMLWCYDRILEHPFLDSITKEYEIANNRIAEALGEMNNIHPVRLMGTYKYLLKKGFFSYNHSFDSSNPLQDVILNLNRKGLEISCGIGVCRNISDHFQTITQKLGLISKNIVVSTAKDLYRVAGTLENQKEKQLNIVQENDFMTKLQEQICFFCGNHVINGLEYDGKAYWNDVTNSICFKKRDFKNLEVYNAKDLIEAGYPKKDYLVPIIYRFPKLNDIDMKATKSLLQKESVSFEEVLEEYYLGKNFAQEHISLFEKMYEANKDNYYYVSDGLQQLEKSLIKYKKLSHFTK